MLFACATLFAADATAQVKPAPKKAPVRSTAKPAAKPTVKKAAPVSAIKAKPIVKDNSIKVKITTDSGAIVVKLSDSTPLHRDNFIKLVKEGFYDSLMFHRVIAGFMIQGGDPQSKYAPSGIMLGSGGGDMARIPAEFKSSLIHKKGALAAARDGNPEKASSACQFYIVDGKALTDAELDMMEARQGRKYTPQQRLLYKTIGGTAMLDTQYTVFGEVISGMEVIGKIANVAKDRADRPLGDVRMKMEVMK
ncbi:MAG: peptidylprolyl isomerase [Chitinophagaceae bacterium]|nr:MAG: peptidylprolyl isomerase [Chitinophagaceae bacterium]